MCLAYIQEAILLMRLRPVRTFLSLAGIFVGTLTIMAVLMLHAGAEREMDSASRVSGAQLLLVTPGIDPSSSAVGVLSMDHVNRLRTVPQVSSCLPRQFQRKESRSSTAAAQLDMLGVDDVFSRLYRVPVVRGRFFLSQEVARKSRVCILTQKGVQLLYPHTEAVGSTLLIQGEPYEVIGVVQWDAVTSRRAFVPSTPDVLVPFLNLMGGLEKPQFSLVEVRVDLAANSDQVETSLRALLSRYDRKREKLFQIQSYASYTAGNRESLQRMLRSLLAMALISLLIGAIGISNVMLISVMERMSEIGIRKALGARREDILIQFLVESGVLTGIGAFAAVGAATVSASLIPFLVRSPLPIAFPVGSIVICLFFSIGVGFVAGAYPANRAAMVSPAETLRGV